jgi:hypothetical protein
MPPHGRHPSDRRRRGRRGPRGGRAPRPALPGDGRPRAPRAPRDRDLEPQQRGVHAGIYYPRARSRPACAWGEAPLRAVRAPGVPHRRTTKLIVATAPGETADLERLLALGRRNGAPLAMLDADACRKLEPAVPAVAGLLSPTTGIVSAHGLMDALLHETRLHGAILQPRAEVVAIERRDRDYRLEVRTPDGVESLTSERVVNAAGLDSDTVAALAGIDVAAAGYLLHWWKGSYFAVSGERRRGSSRAPRLPRPHPRAPRGPRRPRASTGGSASGPTRITSRTAGTTTPSTRRSARPSARPCAGCSRRSRTGTSRPTSPGSAPSSRDRARASGTSWSRRRRRAAVPASSASSGSTRRGSPPPSPSPRRSIGSSRLARTHEEGGRPRRPPAPRARGDLLERRVARVDDERGEVSVGLDLREVVEARHVRPGQVLEGLLDLAAGGEQLRVEVVLARQVTPAAGTLTASLSKPAGSRR